MIKNLYLLKNSQNSIIKINKAKRFEVILLQEHIWIADKHMERRSVSSVTRITQIKSMTHGYPPGRMAKTKKKDLPYSML